MNERNLLNLAGASAIAILAFAAGPATAQSVGVDVGGDGVSAGVSTGDTGGTTASADVGGTGVDADVGTGDGTASASLGTVDGVDADADIDLGGTDTTNATADVNLGDGAGTATLDLNDDGTIDGTDASLQAGLDVNGDGVLSGLDDVNGDGVIDAADGATGDISLALGTTTGTPGTPDPGIGGLADIPQDQLVGVLNSLSASDVAALKQKCVDILGNPAGASEAAISVCQVVASI
jgi:hypothetical protein